MRQTAVVGSQKRLMRCFCELDAASPQHKNRKAINISFYAREPRTIATSPMKSKIIPHVCWSPGGSIELGSWRQRRTWKKTNNVSARGSKLLGPYKGSTALESCLLAAVFLRFGNADLACKSLTLCLSHLYILAKRQRTRA